MPFSPVGVVSILLSEFGSPEDSTAATREERKIAARFATILREDAATFVGIEKDEDLDADDSTHNDSYLDYSDDEDGSTTSGNEVYFGTSAISPDQRTHHGKSYVIYVSTGLVHQSGFGDVVLLLFWFALSSSLFILANSFVYRYIHICRPELSFLYTSRRWVALIYAFNVLIFCNTGYVLIAILVPNEAFRAEVYAENIEVSANAFIGVSLVHTISEVHAFMTIDTIVAMLMVSASGLFCAIRIHLTLKQAAISPHVKRLQRQMFRVLLCQTICPVMFLYFPSCAINALLFGGFDSSPLISDCLAFLISMYPFFNPVVTMLSISDYRSYSISLLRSSKSSAQVHSVSYSNRIVNVPERSAA